MLWQKEKRKGIMFNERMDFLYNFYSHVLEKERYRIEELKKQGWLEEKGAEERGLEEILAIPPTVAIILNRYREKAWAKLSKYEKSHEFDLAIYEIAAKNIANNRAENLELIETRELKGLQQGVEDRYGTEILVFAYVFIEEPSGERKKYLVATNYEKHLDDGGPELVLLNTGSLERTGEQYIRRKLDDRWTEEVLHRKKHRRAN